METILVTGGAGFFGRILKLKLLASGYQCVSFDLVRDETQHENLVNITGDLRDQKLVEEVFAKYRFSAVQHCAAALAHGLKIDAKEIWECNVDASRNVAEASKRHSVRSLVFTSTNCLWASNPGHPIAEDEPPAPIEPYGCAKLEAENVLKKYTNDLDVVIIRCPTIIDSGRLGLLAILFEFIDDNKTIWLVGPGNNRYQFIYADDLAAACIKAMRLGRSDVFHVGSDHVETLREVFEAVIKAAGSKSRTRSVPKSPAIFAMKLANKMHLSPLGPYHYKMIAEDFVFDTAKIKKTLDWSPSLKNSEMLVRAYQYYAAHRSEIELRTDVSAHSKGASMGAIRILKWIS
ncbi:MAG: NAD-dependent epimerase/dehydratase family protein [Terracidiphilus sp.]